MAVFAQKSWDECGEKTTTCRGADEAACARAQPTAHLARTSGARLGGGRREAGDTAAVTENTTRKRRYEAKLFPALNSCSSVRPSISASTFARFALTILLTRLRRLTIGRAAGGAEPLRPEPLRPVPLRLSAGSTKLSASAGSSGSTNSGGSLSTNPTLGPRLDPPPMLFFLLPARTAWAD
jgi:hypothetical protein